MPAMRQEEADAGLSMQMTISRKVRHNSATSSPRNEPLATASGSNAAPSTHRERRRRATRSNPAWPHGGDARGVPPRPRRTLHSIGSRLGRTDSGDLRVIHRREKERRKGGKRKKILFVSQRENPAGDSTIQRRMSVERANRANSRGRNDVADISLDRCSRIVPIATIDNDDGARTFGRSFSRT